MRTWYSFNRTAVTAAASLLALCATACSGGGGAFVGAVPSTSTATHTSTPATPSPDVTASAAPKLSSPGTPAATATPSPGNQSTPSNQPTPSAAPTSSGGSTSVPNPPTASPTNSAAPAPTATPRPATPAPTASPVPVANTPIYDPPAGTYPYFPSSVFLQKIPSNPTVNANSASWLATEGTIGFGSFQIPENAAGLSHDHGFPIYMASSGAGAEPVTVHCTANWGTCGVEGLTLDVDSRERPEGGGGSGDSHFALVNPATGKEYDFWGTNWPASNGVLDIGWGGKCTLSGNGTDGCSGTASDTPLSLGIIRVKDLLLAIQSSTGSLPFALQVAVKCSNGHVAPATSSDGNCSGGPPQGARAYLAMHDSDINATNNPPLAKAILRTMDEDHYGMIVTDTNGGSDGFSLEQESDLTYTSFGQSGPFVSQFVPEAQAEGLNTTPYNNVYTINLGYNGIDFASKLKFL